MLLPVGRGPVLESGGVGAEKRCKAALAHLVKNSRYEGLFIIVFGFPLLRKNSSVKVSMLMEP